MWLLFLGVNRCVCGFQKGIKFHFLENEYFLCAKIYLFFVFVSYLLSRCKVFYFSVGKVLERSKKWEILLIY